MTEENDDNVVAALAAALSTEPRRPSVEQILHDRGRTHGDFDEHATITQRLKQVMRDTPGWYNLSYAMRESLEMECHKNGRILAGDPDFRDHWDDKAGYAKLVANRCSK